MKELLLPAIATSKNIYEVSEATLNVLSLVRREHPDQTIVYVAGAITADGPDKIEENSRILAERAAQVRKVHPLTFSAPDIFTPEVYQKIKGLSLPQEQYFHFFRRKLRSGFIDVVYMTPGWVRSSGSRDEYQTAHTNGITVVEMEKHPIWKWVDVEYRNLELSVIMS